MTESKISDLLVQSVGLEEMSDWIHRLFLMLNQLKAELREESQKPIFCPQCHVGIYCITTPDLKTLRLVSERTIRQGYVLDLICPNCKAVLNVSASLGFVNRLPL